jgi:hypothetical protein
MKATYKIMIVLMLGGLASLFFINGPAGKPILTLDDFKPDVALPEKDALMSQVNALRSGLSSDATSGQPQAPTYYRWQDAEGNWQYGDRPPPGVTAEIRTADNISVVPPVDLPDREPASQRQQAPAQLQGTALLPGNALDTLKQAVDIEGQLQQSLEDREAQLR